MPFLHTRSDEEGKDINETDGHKDDLTDDVDMVLRSGKKVSFR